MSDVLRVASGRFDVVFRSAPRALARTIEQCYHDLDPKNQYRKKLNQHLLRACRNALQNDYNNVLTRDGYRKQAEEQSSDASEKVGPNKPSPRIAIWAAKKHQSFCKEIERLRQQEKNLPQNKGLELKEIKKRFFKTSDWEKALVGTPWREALFDAPVKQTAYAFVKYEGEKLGYKFGRQGDSRTNDYPTIKNHVGYGNELLQKITQSLINHEQVRDVAIWAATRFLHFRDQVLKVRSQYKSRLRSKDHDSLLVEIQERLLEGLDMHAVFPETKPIDALLSKPLTQTVYALVNYEAKGRRYKFSRIQSPNKRDKSTLEAYVLLGKQLKVES